VTPETIHTFFETAALLAGVQAYRLTRRAAGGGGLLDKPEYAVAVGCILGAALGNKMVFWAAFPHMLAEHWRNVGFWFSGQSVVGGLLGGLLGVEIAKAITGQRRSTGDYFVTPFLLGLVIGRIGCFLSGLSDGTYGNPSTLPWAVDFGDGIPRHPTQLYEIGFAILLWLTLRHYRERLATVPGLGFKLMLSSYLLWRLVVDGIKPIPYPYPGGLSGIQFICLLALVCYLPLVWRDLKRLPA